MDATLVELREALAHFLDREVAAAAVLGEAQATLAPQWLGRLGELGYLDFGADDASDGLGLHAQAIVVAEVGRVWGALAVSVAATLVAARALERCAPGHGLVPATLRAGQVAVAVGRLCDQASDNALLAVGAPQPQMVLLLPQRAQACVLPSNAPPAVPCATYEGLRGLHATTVSPTDAHPLSAQDSADLLCADRILLAAAAAGLAQGALDRGVAYAIERVQFGQPIGAYGEIQALLVRASTRTVAARHTALFAAQRFDQQDRSVEMATHAFLHNTQAAVSVGERTQHVYGGYGQMAPYQAGRYVRDARTLATLVGSHAQLDRLLADDLGLPRARAMAAQD